MEEDEDDTEQSSQKSGKKKIQTGSKSNYKEKGRSKRTHSSKKGLEGDGGGRDVKNEICVVRNQWSRGGQSGKNETRN